MGERGGLLAAERPVEFGLAMAAVAVLVLGVVLGAGSAIPREGPRPFAHSTARAVTPTNGSAVGNFSTAIDRLVELLGVAGSGILSLVWARVALSWFSNDVTKKVQAKDRARDALVGTLLFTGAITGLFWGLAHWVLTGS